MVLNVTVTSTQRAGALTEFTDGQPLLGVPNLTFSGNQTVSNLLIAPVVNGGIDFYNGSSGNIQVVADLVGYYTS